MDLAQDDQGVPDAMEHVVGDHQIEAPGLEGQLLGVPEAHADAVLELLLRDAPLRELLHRRGEHHDLEGKAGIQTREPDRDARASSAHVQHAPAGHTHAERRFREPLIEDLSVESVELVVGLRLRGRLFDGGLELPDDRLVPLGAGRKGDHVRAPAGGARRDPLAESFPRVVTGVEAGCASIFMTTARIDSAVAVPARKSSPAPVRRTVRIFRC